MKVCLMRAALLLAICAPLLAAAPPLPAEHLTVTTLAPNTPHRIYVLDEAFNNEIDARIHVFDGDTYQRLGQIDAGFNPGFNLSPDGKTTVVGTTYFARGSRPRSAFSIRPKVRFSTRSTRQAVCSSFPRDPTGCQHFARVAAS